MGFTGNCLLESLLLGAPLLLVNYSGMITPLILGATAQEACVAGQRVLWWQPACQRNWTGDLRGLGVG